MLPLKKLVVKLLKEALDNLDAGNTDISESEAMYIVSMLTHVPLSKEKACLYLNISRSKFDELVREKLIPKGRKRVGFKELCWWKDELDECKEYIKSKK